MSGNTGFGSLTGYAMSDSDNEDEFHNKLSGNISGSDDESSHHSASNSRGYSPVDEPVKKKPAPGVSSLGLVSYGAHDDEDDSDAEGRQSDGEEESSEPTNTDQPSSQTEIQPEEKGAEPSGGLDMAGNGEAAGNEAPQNAEEEAEDDEDDVVIPPSPPGKCPESLINTIQAMHKRVRYGGFNLDATIQSSKDFRNPSIYEKLISHVGIDEKATNYPPELYDPSIWDESSYYDELAKVQNAEMDKRNKERKDRVKVDFISATKTDSDGSGHRKTKWDTGASTVSMVAASGTTITTIPAVGSLIKKK